MQLFVNTLRANRRLHRSSMKRDTAWRSSDLIQISRKIQIQVQQTHALTLIDLTCPRIQYNPNK